MAAKRVYGRYFRKLPKRYINTNNTKRKRVSNERKELESEVRAINRILKYAVQIMSLEQLLCNCHPMYRNGHARDLYDTGQISKKLYKKIISKKIKRI